MSRYKDVDVLTELGGDIEESELPETILDPEQKVLPKSSVSLTDIEHLNNTPSDVQEIGVSVQEITQVAKEDLNFLAAMIMPHIFEFEFPPAFRS